MVLLTVAPRGVGAGVGSVQPTWSTPLHLATRPALPGPQDLLRGKQFCVFNVTKGSSWVTSLSLAVSGRSPAQPAPGRGPGSGSRRGREDAPLCRAVEIVRYTLSVGPGVPGAPGTLEVALNNK